MAGRRRPMITYKIASHVPGRIRLLIPLVKVLSVDDLMRLSKLPVPEVIKNLRANPLTGSITIEYDPVVKNILEYIDSFSSSAEVRRIVKKYLPG
ncbi:MAG: hypothetical protein HY887_00935 [Deltaproteobacteria bacterium]|nr:hypothetical protein [Deltaproteobacteria bacterium]